VILVIGSPHDRTVVHTLAAAGRVGVSYRFLDIVRFLRTGRYRWDLDQRGGGLGHDSLDVQLPDPRISGIYVRLVDISGQVDEAERPAVRARLRALTEMLRNVDALVVNRPGLDMSNWAKAYHLHLLSSCGFTVPRSLLTNDPHQARAFLDTVSAAVFKGASGEKTIASAYRPDLRSRLPLLPASPVLFQERILGADVRTHLVGPTFVSERIVSEGVNYQYDGASTTYEPTSVPAAVERMCRAYQAVSGLAFIGFDFKVTAEAEHVVLEANPMPGYDVFDRRLGYTISGALFDLLQGSAGR
jgi:glutathione synthase/RimK-type ligase-like ATP-grasp enzyme